MQWVPCWSLCCAIAGSESHPPPTPWYDRAETQISISLRNFWIFQDFCYRQTKNMVWNNKLNVKVTVLTLTELRSWCWFLAEAVSHPCAYEPRLSLGYLWHGTIWLPVEIPRCCWGFSCGTETVGSCVGFSNPSASSGGLSELCVFWERTGQPVMWAHGSACSDPAPRLRDSTRPQHFKLLFCETHVFGRQRRDFLMWKTWCNNKESKIISLLICILFYLPVLMETLRWKEFTWNLYEVQLLAIDTKWFIVHSTTWTFSRRYERKRLLSLGNSDCGWPCLGSNPTLKCSLQHVVDKSVLTRDFHPPDSWARPGVCRRQFLCWRGGRGHLQKQWI